MASKSKNERAVRRADKAESTRARKNAERTEKHGGSMNTLTPQSHPKTDTVKPARHA